MNNLDCPPSSYLSTAEFNSKLYHWFSVINTPFNLLVIYLIRFKSPENMQNVKSSLLVLQICSAICDFSIGTLAIPFVCFPVMGFWTNGVFTFLGVSPGVQAYFVIVMIAETAATSVMMFENRYRYLKAPRAVDSKHTKTILLYIINTSMPILLTTLTVLDVPSQDNIKQFVLETIQCPSQDIQTLPIYVLSKNLNLTILAITLLLTFYTVQLYFFMVKSMRKLQEQTHNTAVSELTRKLEKKFYYAIAAQSLFPFLFITIPVSYFVFSMFTSYHNQAMNNFAMFLISAHGTVGSILFLVINKSYRKAITKKWFTKQVRSSF